MSALPSPVAQWEEPPSAGAAGTLTRLVPYKTAAGYWVFLPERSGPPGSAEGAILRSGGVDVFYLTPGVGLRITRSVSGPLLIY